MVNKAIIMGFLGRDPELRSVGSGKSVCNLNIATSEKFKAADGSMKEKTEWHTVVIWDKLAENAAKYLKKGSGVYVEGRIETRKWTDKNGNERYSTEIQGQTVRFLPGGNRDGAGSGNQRPASGGGGQQQLPASGGGASDGGGGGYDPSDEIPF